MGISSIKRQTDMDGQGGIIYPPLVRPLVLADKDGQTDKVSAKKGVTVYVRCYAMIKKNDTITGDLE